MFFAALQSVNEIIMFGGEMTELETGKVREID